MAETLKPGCKRPTAKSVAKEGHEIAHQEDTSTKEDNKMIFLGQPAPNFTAPGYLNGQFVEVKLSEYFGDGKWALLCFYPGDFTFV